MFGSQLLPPQRTCGSGCVPSHPGLLILFRQGSVLPNDQAMVVFGGSVHCCIVISMSPAFSTNAHVIGVGTCSLLSLCLLLHLTVQTERRVSQESPVKK